MFLIALFFCRIALASEADEDRYHHMRVTPVSPLNLGIVVQGDPAEVIPPGSSENNRNASFLVEGPKHQSYTVVLPQDRVFLLPTKGQGAGLRLRDFKSNPPEATCLDENGRQMVYVGATRDAIARVAPQDDYIGYFTIVILY